MNKGFLKFKRRMWYRAAIKGVIAGLSLGALVSAAYATYQKVNAVEPELVVCALLGAAVAVVVGLIVFLLSRPTNKRLAQRIDKDLALGEKVQTMLAFKKSDDTIAVLQREDADRRLLEAPARRVKERHWWKHILSPLLASAMVAVACITPLKVIEPPPLPEEPPYDATDWQLKALDELIENVKKSEMEASPKGLVVQRLEGLRDVIESIDKQDDMKEAVIGTISYVNKVADDANSNAEIADAMEKRQSTALGQLDDAIRTLNGVSAEKELKAIRETLVGMELDSLLEALTADIDGALSESKIASTDKLYTAFDDLSASLKPVREKIGSYTSANIQSDIDAAFAPAYKSVNSALLAQYCNDDVAYSTVVRLMEIFGITKDDLPEEDVPMRDSDLGSDEEQEEDDEKAENDGGLGSGEIIYGSDDMIYDPDKGEYVVYGTVINDYYPTVVEKMFDSGIPDDLEEFVLDYFATLFNGTADEENE